MARLPTPRGPISEFLIAELELGLHEMPYLPPVQDDPIEGDDLHLALFVCYELHARGFDGIDGRWEWEPSLLSFRGALEERFEHALCCAVGPAQVNGRPIFRAVIDALAGLDTDASPVAPAVVDIAGRRAVPGPELALHRSPLRTAQADAYTYAIPRLPLGARPYLRAVGAQARAGRSGPRLPGEGEVRGWTDRRSRPTEELSRIPGPSLAAANLVSLLGLHRRHRGALAGHAILAGVSASGAPHERSRLAGSSAMLCEVLLDAEPELAADVLFGARAAIELERRFRRLVLGRRLGAEGSLIEAFGQRALRASV